MYNSKSSNLRSTAGLTGDQDLMNVNSTAATTAQSQDSFSHNVSRSLLGNSNNERILTHSHKAPIAPPQESKIKLRTAQRNTIDARHFQPKQYEHLKAPYLSNDYRHSELSWSTKNQLAVSLGEQLYIYDVLTRCPTELPTPLKGSSETAEPITSVQFSPDGSHVAVGRVTRVEVYDTQAQKCVRRIKAHTQSICDIAWYTGTSFALASEDGTISVHDLTQKVSTINTFMGHTDAVLSIKWSLEEIPLYLASGSSDNSVCIWDVRKLTEVRRPALRYTDASASTKALAWCPFTTTNVLAVGGGAEDGHIRLYDVSNDLTAANATGSGRSLKPFEVIDTGSQITSLNFALDDKELITTHGFKNPNQVDCETNDTICTWRYPSLVRTSSTNTFNDRLLFGTTSPLGSFVAFGQPIDNQGIAQQGSVYIFQMWETPEQKQQRMAAIQSKGSMTKLSSKIR